MPTVRFQLRRDTAANWASVNPTLGAGEPALETDTLLVKYGDGATAWNDLDYAAVELPGDLAAIAGIVTAAWGRGLLALAAPADLRSLLGCPYTLAQSAVGASVAGTTSETVLASYAIPANSLGAHGSAEFMMLFGYTNSANTKNLRLRINGAQVLALTPTTTASGQFLFTLANRGTANSQVASATGFVGITTASGSEQTFSFDTTSSLAITITGQLTNSSEQIRLARHRCMILPG